MANAGVIKGLLIGILLMSGIMVGALSFLVSAYNSYGTLDNTSSVSNALSNTLVYMNSVNQTAINLQGNVTGSGAVSYGQQSWLGLVFNYLGIVGEMFITSGQILLTALNDMVAYSGELAIPIPPWFVGIIMAIIIIVLVIMVITLFTGRVTQDL